MSRDQQKICREEWFKDHVAKLVGYADTPSVKIIEWKKPNSWNYGCRFIIHSQWLCVVGDLGEATYQWSDTLTLPFLGSLNFDYFKGKCRASEVGSRFDCFDSRIIQSFKKGMTPDELEFVEDELSSGGLSKPDVEAALHTAIAQDRIGLDFASAVIGWGTIPHPRCVGHFVGLQMAIAQLHKEQPLTAP